MAIRDELIEELLAGKDPQKIFSSDGLLDELKKALAERILNAIKRHQEPSQGRHGEPSHLRYCDASADADADVALISPERRFSRSR